ncbi:MAG TPA: LysM peptidoglycan-binding domain-containing protein [Microbacteriaceae bacterium]|nr:LysM peptidoglycan-binding domain-containing protein [Microbacteriaceae bacterium]
MDSMLARGAGVGAETRTSEARLRLTRRGRAVLTTLVAAPAVVLVVAASLLAGAAQAAGRDSAAAAAAYSHSVTVQQGDSLWSVAMRVAPDDDPRIVVRDIAQLNDVTGTALTPGERLAIPERYTGR